MSNAPRSPLGGEGRITPALSNLLGPDGPRWAPRRGAITPVLGVLVAAALMVFIVILARSPATAVDAGPISRSGTYEGGQYVIEVPAGWNGGLVLFAHGLDGSLASPLSLHLREQGYALVASSYRTLGYRVDLFIDDMRALFDLFVREVRRPRWAIIHGQSMGGHVGDCLARTLPRPLSRGAHRVRRHRRCGHRRLLRGYPGRCGIPGRRQSLRCAGPVDPRAPRERTVAAPHGGASRLHGAGSALRQRPQVPDGRRSAAALAGPAALLLPLSRAVLRLGRPGVRALREQPAGAIPHRPRLGDGRG